ncbi:hypothetical protein IFM89_037666 [Coptis chinensis]|uniref:Methyltransferase-related protein n=1 Tax=Coptis chinensis TaxID=261450 RepID=A0A835LTY8_9MAGN|nr:hypothetical protein IFM89_037332 [Coptis chinensis]KAF9617603.1 hypothetical protein IFM89_037666 [Coptis chinensis]
MCPLRFILVFLSATLAGYLAWRTVRSSSSNVDDVLSNDATAVLPKQKQEFSFKKVVQDGFYVFVDMASGRYLWRNLMVNSESEKAKEC